MTHKEYAVIMYAAGFDDGSHHYPSKYETEDDYALGYVEGENSV